jgi:hypothetical protein
VGVGGGVGAPVTGVAEPTGDFDGRVAAAFFVVGVAVGVLVGTRVGVLVVGSSSGITTCSTLVTSLTTGSITTTGFALASASVSTPLNCAVFLIVFIRTPFSPEAFRLFETAATSLLSGTDISAFHAPARRRRSPNPVRRRLVSHVATMLS